MFGKSIGSEGDVDIAGADQKLRVFTTRPDTLFGVTFMVIAPEHPLIEEMKDRITNMDAIVKYTAGITGVILYKVGETPTEKMEALAAENAELKKTVDMLQGCILELSEMVYQ